LGSTSKKGFKGDKILQMVWIDFDTYAEIHKRAREAGVAPNVMIAEIVKSAIKNKELKILPRQVQYVEVKKYLCAVCLGEFDDVNGLVNHLRNSSYCLETFKNGLANLPEVKYQCMQMYKL